MELNLPKAIEIEEHVLGVLLFHGEAIHSVVNILQPEAFFSSKNRETYKAMLRLCEDKKYIDLILVFEELKGIAEVDLNYLVELTVKIGTSLNIVEYALILMQYKLLRDYINHCISQAKIASQKGADIFDCLNITDDFIKKTNASLVKPKVKKAESVYDEMILSFDAQKSADNTNKISTGLIELDKIIYGLQKTDFIVVAARPAMGKSAFMLNIASSIASNKDRNESVAIFSLEMGKKQLIERITSNKLSIELEKFKTLNFTEDETKAILNFKKEVSNWRLFIDDTSILTLNELRAQCAKLKESDNLSVVLVDYIQLMQYSTTNKNKSYNREQEIAQIARGLKSMAKELDINVIGLAQLSRSVETRSGDKKPLLSDLRESGAIEQDADLVMFLYRPEYYGFEVDKDGNPTKGMAEIIIAKHRNGATGSAICRFSGRYSRFYNEITTTQFDNIETPF